MEGGCEGGEESGRRVGRVEGKWKERESGDSGGKEEGEWTYLSYALATFKVILSRECEHACVFISFQHKKMFMIRTSLQLL